MIGGRKPHLGEVVAFARAEHDRADDLLGAVVPARLREEPQTRAASVLDNVVPFVRPRSNDNARPAGPALAFGEAARPAPLTGRPYGVTQRAGLVGLSLLVHAATFAALAFWYIPAPLNGTEPEAISVELVPPGSNTPAGRSASPSPDEGMAQDGRVTETPDEKPPVEQAEEPTTDQPQDVKIAEQEAAPEQPVVAEQAPQPAPKEPEPVLAPQEPEPRESIAMVESPNTPEIATEKPPEVAPEKPIEPEKLTLLPQAPPPEEKPAEPPKPELQQPELPKPEPKKPVLRDPEPQKQPEPKKPEPKKPVAKKQEAKPKAKEATRIAARTAERTIERPAGPQSTVGSNGTGLGAATRANYAGLVSAHLQRNKRPLPDGQTGRAGVAFNVDRSGRVTSVRVFSPSGNASVDQEIQAMVRRASPFPPPPPEHDGRFHQYVGFGVR
jgi:protein TonB